MKNKNTTSHMNAIQSGIVRFFTATVILLILGLQVKAAEQGAQFKVKGTVFDAATGNPIAAAQIQAINSMTSAVTDEQGSFEIKVKNVEDILSVNAFDHVLREVSIKGKSNLRIDLYPETFNSYFKNFDVISGNQRSFANNSSAKGLTDFNIPQAISPDEFIQSELGGDARSIYHSGNSGYGISMFIRGLNTLNANAQPLLVVDGVIWNRNNSDDITINKGFINNPLANIEAGDIESIVVLKDGVAIYGSKASNGVVLIKTQRGKSAVTKINFTAMTGLTSTPDNVPMMSGSDYKIYATEMLGTRGLTKNQISKFNFLKEDKQDIQIYNINHNNTNWQNEVYQTGKTQSYAINVNGGDERALYYFSLGYTGNNGIVKSTSMSRIHTRFNADINMSRVLSSQLNLALTTIDHTLLDDGTDSRTSPTFLSLAKSPIFSPHTYTQSGTITKDLSDADEFGISNPSAIIDKALNYSRKYRFNIGLKPRVNFSKSLFLTSQFDYSLDKNKENYFQPMLGTSEIQLEGFGSSYNYGANQVIRNINLTNDTRLTFNKTIANFHKLNAFVGWRYINNYFESDVVSAHNTGADNNRLVNSSYKYAKVDGTNLSANSISNYANISYSFNDKYFLDANAALDGSSRFGKETKGGYKIYDHTWGLFPSVTGSWMVSSEEFMKNISMIDMLRVRAGFSSTGNDGIQDYATKAYFSTRQYLSNQTGAVLTNLSNESLQWETTNRLSAGFDMGLLNDRVLINADFYTSRTKDLLTLNSLGDISGLDYYWNNGGELTNKGFEISANAKAINTKDFQWEIGASVGHYKNRIESLPENDKTITAYGATILSRVGQPAGVFYGYKTNGVFATDAEAAAANLHIVNYNGSYSYFNAGDVRFIEDKSHVDHTINEKDMQIIGDPNPDFYGSFSSRFSYKKISLNALFTYSVGNDVYNSLRRELESVSNMNNQTTAVLNRWRQDGQITNQPRATWGDPMQNSRFSDRWIEDGSYLKLKTISVSYKLPVKTSFLEGVSVWVAANNLLTITKYLGADPEFSAGNSVLVQGVDAGLVPQTRSFFAGVKINL